jgi:hypothetical protein
MRKGSNKSDDRSSSNKMLVTLSAVCIRFDLCVFCCVLCVPMRSAVIGITKDTTEDTKDTKFDQKFNWNINYERQINLINPRQKAWPRNSTNDSCN